MKKTMKLTAAVLALAMLAIPASGFAENMEAASAPISVEEPMPDSLRADGSVCEIRNEENDQYIVIGDEADPLSQKRFNVGPETVMIQADGMPITLADIKQGANIIAYHSLAQTMSLPPQSFAEVIILLSDEDELAPLYVTVGSVTDGEEATELLTKDGSYLFFVNEETYITPYRTRNIVTLSDIRVGSKLFVWTETMTASLPGQAAPHKVVLIASPEAEVPVSAISLNGEILDADVEIVDETVMVPIRAISEKMGYTVAWNGEEKSVCVGEGPGSLTAVLGQKEIVSPARIYEIMDAAATLVDGVTYVPTSFFARLLGDENAVTISEGVVNILK